MAHRHKIGDKLTGPGIYESGQSGLHYHFIEGRKTDTVHDEDKHTHIIGNDITGWPVTDNEESISIMDIAQDRPERPERSVVEVKSHSESPDGHYGYVSGYIATWHVDRGKFGIRDQFLKGCFAECLADYRARGRNIQVKDLHGIVIGMFPLEKMYEDDYGLFAEAELNLKTTRGYELYWLARQGAIADFSVGWSSLEDTEQDGIRSISKAYLWEASLVDVPMNPHAIVTDIKSYKSVVAYQDLPIADSDREWDADKALENLRAKFSEDGAPTEGYKHAFVVVDDKMASTYAGYKLPIADIEGDQLTIIPAALHEAADRIKSGSVVISPFDRPGAIQHLEKYFAKMDLPSPFSPEEKRAVVRAVDLGQLETARSIETMLRKSGVFTSKAAKVLAGRLKLDKNDKKVDNGANDMAGILQEIKAIKDNLQKS